MTMDNYLSRYIESTISKKMKSSGVVLVEGPKFCGKTTTSALFAKSEIRLNTLDGVSGPSDHRHHLTAKPTQTP